MTNLGVGIKFKGEFYIYFFRGDLILTTGMTYEDEYIKAFAFKERYERNSNSIQQSMPLS